MAQLSKDEAIAEVERQKFVDDNDREVVHCFLGTIGADWDAIDVLTLIAQDDAQVSWQWTLFGRCLVVITDEHRYVFDTITEPDQEQT